METVNKYDTLRAGARRSFFGVAREGGAEPSPNKKSKDRAAGVKTTDHIALTLVRSARMHLCVASTWEASAIVRKPPTRA